VFLCSKFIRLLFKYHKITEEYTLRTALFIKAEQQDQFDFEIAKKEEVKEKKMQNNKAITLI
jgi:hypothetical protein